MLRIEWSASALEDIEALFDYVAEHSSLWDAENLCSRLLRSTDRLAEFPRMYEAAPQYGQGVRRISLAGQHVLYEVDEAAQAVLVLAVNVADGDTITILDNTNTQHKIRLTGIDAPEKRQAFGNVSKQSLADMVAGQSVTVEWVKADRYGRKLGKVLLAGLDCNLAQVKRGLAWHYKQYQREQSPTDQQSYAAAEIEARQVQAGLWRDVEQVPPWEFRHQR